MSTIITTSSPASPPPGGEKITIEEFVARYANKRAELVKGIVKEAPMPFPRHGKICLTIGALIFNHVTSNDLGHVMSNDSWIKTGPESVRGGDVCYWSYQRLPKGPIPEGLLPTAPDLVVEVKSPTDGWGELFGKVSEYLRAGVQVVVVIDPTSSSVSVYREDAQQQILFMTDELTVPDVLPGFVVSVAHLFC